MAEKIRYWSNPEAHREASRRYYATHPKARADNLVRAISQTIAKRMVVDIYKAMGCADCGETDPDVLEFDHVTGNKVGNVSTMIQHSSWSALVCEMNKCEIRCANCHARVTLRRHRASATS